MDSLKHARAMKADMESIIPSPRPQDETNTTRRKFSDDPEVALIKELRRNQQMSWGEIVKHLNEERIKMGGPPSLTAQLVYSKYAYSTPCIATAVDEIGFKPKDYMHLRQPVHDDSTVGLASISKAGKKRVKNYDDATELKSNVRQVLDAEDGDSLDGPVQCEQLVEAVAKVQRNFWVLVADEMERATTKLYDPDTLAKQYYSI
ncbi:hypothetical protein ACN47E_009740 [Coniothyrium glycines]